MSIRLDAERLLDQVNQTETVLRRMKQNRAYETRGQEAERLYERVRQQTLVVPSFVERIDSLELVDPLHISRPNEWMDIGILVAKHQNRFVREVEEPLAELLQNVEGSAAKARWVPEPSKAGVLAPILEVRERWATLVGVSDYQKAGLTSLSTSKSDASAIHDLLLSDQRYGDQSAQTRLFVDSTAQRVDILSAIENAAQAANGGDMLLFYFSGHGDLKDGDAILIPYDYDRAAPKDSAVRIAEVMGLMNSSRAHVKIIILDACHSGPDIPLGDEEKKGVEKEMGMDPDFERRVFDQARGSALLAACVARQASWTYRAKGLSAFTYFFCEGLRGAADFGRKGFVTVSDAFHYVANEVQQWAEERNLRQTPALSYTTTGEIILMDYRQGKAK